MDQPQTDKFSELSPVLELVYVMLTNMAKYVDVYATDIDASKLTQYLEAKAALAEAIKKFDVLYGLQSAASLEDETSEDEADVEETTAVVSASTDAPASNMAAGNQPYDFASGNDPDSMKKAKQAVEELKTLFADMKKQEMPQPAVAPVATPVVEVAQAPVAPQNSMPTFVPTQTPAASLPVVPTTSVETAPAPVPTPMNTPAPQQDAGEIDSILAELKKLQNKGSQAL